MKISKTIRLNLCVAASISYQTVGSGRCHYGSSLSRLRATSAPARWGPGSRPWWHKPATSPPTGTSSKWSQTHQKSSSESEKGRNISHKTFSRNKTFLKLKLKIFPTGMLFRSPQLSSAPAFGLGQPPTGPYPMSPGHTQTLWQKSRQRGSTFSAKNVSHSR